MADRLGRAVGVAGGDTLEHLAVLGEDGAHALRPADRERAGEPHDPAKRHEELAGALEAEERRHGQVELLVDLEESVRVAHELGLAVEDRAEPAHIDGARLAREAPYDVRFDEAAELEDLAHLCLGDRAQPEAALRDDLDDPLARKLDERLAHRRARDMQLLGDLDLGVEGARAEHAGPDGRAERGIGPPRERL